MSIKELINDLATVRDWDCAHGGSGAKAIEKAIDLLKTHPEAQPNEPLTMEELREMGGKPVWTHSDIFPGDCGWRVVKKAGILDVEFTDGRIFNLTDYEKSWTAYRRPMGEDI